MAIETGGPAFPKAALNAWGDVIEMHKGMTLRDYFAAKAMQSILSNMSQGIKPQDCIAVAEDSYFIADRMLEARK